LLRANGERLKASLLEMARIGATPAGGVTRPALTDTDREARDLFARWARESGLSVRVDDVGNQYARLEGSEPAAAPVLLGSHLDSVPAGGKFDGALGVLVALEVVRSLREAGAQPRRSVEIANFSNEEGVRFEPALLGSGVLVGRYTPEFVYGLRDRDGRTFEEELERIGYKGSRQNRPGTIHAYLEAHIEQGPVLEAEGLPLAVVEGIVGVEWVNVTVEGQPQHAGPSPMRMRRDAMVASARMIAALRDLILTYPDPTAVTVGRLQPVPGVINQIPARVVFSLDFRHSTAEGLDELKARSEEVVRRIASEERVDVTFEPFWRTEPTVFDSALVDLLESSARSTGVPYRRMISGAGHDARFVNDVAPTAMLFIRTLGGKSHCETEEIDWTDAQAAADALLEAVLRLAETRDG
jgi:beta-ureidopropionase / N-carbamoyl-L-amino-acid hydrolase